MPRNTHHKPKYTTIAEAMEELGYTDEKAAQASRCDRTWITRLRRGMKLKSLNTPLRICRALSVPIEALADNDAA